MSARIYTPASRRCRTSSPDTSTSKPQDAFRLVIGRYRLMDSARLLRAIASVLLVDTGASVVISTFVLYHLLGVASGTAEHLACQVALAFGTLVAVAGVVLGTEEAG